MNISNELCLILESIYDAILIIDHKGIVVFVNSGYERVTNVKSAEILGQPLKQIRKNSRLSEVLSTGEPILHVRRREFDKEYFTNLMPIKKDAEIIGAVSMSIELTDVYELLGKLEVSEKKIKLLEEKISQIYGAKYHFEDIIGSSDAMKIAIELAKKIAQKDNTVLIQGESGTGKELFAHSIHNASLRKDKPFIAVNCATLGKDLLESELFGYVGGAFTGGKREGKKGLFEEANGGTLFLDEIGEMDISVQAKLLRVLQEQTIRPIGSNKERKIDTRIICATNRSLEKMIKEGTFREDLFFRIAVFTVEIPPLRNRDHDALHLARKLLERISHSYEMDMEFENFLLSYEWPGNVRELKNVIEYASTMADQNSITMNYLPKYLSNIVVNRDYVMQNQTLSEMLWQKEKEIIKERMNIHGNDLKGKKKVAEELGISLATLYNKLASFENEKF
ncbi:sigma 54-interacting transcriptional regulator [Neobacillus vireti]|uniref:sigma-54 interaction domain-containing protein n=1 Tax=Neobacillus vireti TaxID=220686 RepID=UPI002FFDD569